MEAEQYLYVIGYARFFNDATTGSDTCDGWTFSGSAGLEGGHYPPVSQALRQRMNGLITAFNQRYVDAINAYKAPNNKYVGFISVDDGFENHRFCEPGASFQDQFYSAETYLWNLSAQDGETVAAWNESSISTDPAALQALEDNFSSDGDASTNSGGVGAGSGQRYVVLRDICAKDGIDQFGVGHSTLNQEDISLSKTQFLQGCVPMPSRASIRSLQ